MKSIQMSAARSFTAASALVLFSLAGCGGGGGATETVTVPTPVVSAVTTLQSSGGDLSKYANTVWISDCGIPLVNGIPGLLSQRNTFRFGAAVGTTLSGSISTSQFSNISCTGPTVANSGTVVQVNFNYIRQLTVTSSTPPTAQGTADELLISEVGRNATQTFTVGFLPDFLKFAGGTSSFFNGASLRYNKL